MAGLSVEVPSYYLCPISLEIMRDPVTLATGITYDRDSIEQWVFAGGQSTCPVTKLPLCAGEREPTPNHTLRRLIQSWCAEHAVERFPTPRPPADAARTAALVEEGRQGGQLELAALRELSAIVGESDRNRRCVEAVPGVVEFLFSVVKNHVWSPTTSSPEEEPLSILCSLKLSEESWKRVFEEQDDFLVILAAVVRRPSCRSRTHGVHLLKEAVSVMAPTRLASANAELMHGVVKVVTDRVSAKATKAALYVLCRLCPWGRNRVKAVDAGAVTTLVDLLLDEAGRVGVKRECEMAVVVLDHLCGCAEGRWELSAHPAGLAVVARGATRVSTVATDSAVRVMHAVARCLATPAVLQEMLAVGAVAKLLFMVQDGVAGDRTRERAKEMLRTHARAWKDSPCLAPHLNASYPC